MIKLKLLVLCVLYCACCYSQQHNCRLLYSMTYPVDTDTDTDNDTISEMESLFSRDTIFFKNIGNEEVFFVNNKVYKNKKVIHKFKNVNYLAEAYHLLIDNINYLYIFPVYNGQAGPYIWNSHNGVAIRFDPDATVKNHIPYADYVEICTLELDKCFTEKK